MDICLKRFDLPAEVISMDTNGQAADEVLAALLGSVRGVGEENEAGACSPCGLLLYSVGRS